MSRQEVVPSGMPQESQKTFWAAYNNWLATASDEEIAKLEEGLAAIQSHEVQHIAIAIRHQMADEQRRRMLPTNLVQQLEVVHWPAAAAIG